MSIVNILYVFNFDQVLYLNHHSQNLRSGFVYNTMIQFAYSEGFESSLLPFRFTIFAFYLGYTNL